MPDDIDDESSIVKEWGLQQIYDERRKIIIEGKAIPRNNLDFIAFGLSHFRNANRKPVKWRIK